MMITPNDDNRKLIATDRKNISVQEEVHAILKYLPREAGRTEKQLRELDLLWENSMHPYFVPYDNLLDDLKRIIMEYYFKYEWDSQKPENRKEKTTSFTVMDAVDAEKLIVLWWCYRELKLVLSRIYEWNHPYCKKP